MKFQWKDLWKTGFVIFVFCILWKYSDYAHDLFALAIGALSPLFIGAILAFFINILMSFYENAIFKKCTRKFWQKSKRALSLILALITLLGIIALIMTIVLPQLFECIELIINLFPKLVSIIIEKLDNFDIVPKNIIDFLSNIDWKSKLDQIIDFVTAGIGNTLQVVTSTLTTVFSWIVTAFLSAIFAIYLLISKDNLARQSKKFLRTYTPEKIWKKVLYVCETFNNTFRKYFIGQCTEALILGVLCIIGMLILRLPYAAMIGTLIAFTALIPIAGAYIGGAIGALMIVTVSPMKALIFIIFLVMLQQIEGNIIYQRVVCSTIGLPGIWVLAAITVGGSVAGVLGMLLGVPLTASLYKILKDDLKKRSAPPKVVKEPQKNN
jgi:predicted PurR-regulated permease PerM